jgi:hypothetical protein
VRRRLFTILSGLSLLLCVAVVALWVWTAVTGEHLALAYQGESVAWDVGAGAGRLAVRLDHMNFPPRPGATGWRIRRASMFHTYWMPTRAAPTDHGNLTSWNIWDFSYDYSGFSWGTARGARVPLWFACLVSLVRPAYVAVRICSRLRRVEGHCPSCGYDLRATPERCPECGTAAEQR